jgi:transcriptional regulator with XRE-family HTH domain
MSAVDVAEETRDITTVVSVLSALRGLTQRDIAAVVEVDPATITRRRQGIGQWSSKDLRLLCEHFGVTVDVLWQRPEDLWEAVTTTRTAGWDHVWPDAA